MNLKKEFNRIGHLFNDGVEHAQKESDQWVREGQKQAKKAGRKARKHAEEGAKSIMTFEESMISHARENPALYILGAALLIGILISKLVMESHRDSELPLL